MKKKPKKADEIAQFHYHLISDLKSIPQKAKEALALLDGKIDTLVNNAGIEFPALAKLQKTIY
jgi:3-oxoacyl-[acyl-carrier protein] reductase